MEDAARWQPKSEPGDDEPIFGPLPPISRDKPADQGRRRPERRAAAQDAKEHADEALDIRWTEEPEGPPTDASFAEIFVSVGRRDGAKASDLQRVLTEVAHISRSDTGRIRVRDRNSFVSVKRELLDRAVLALNGAAIAGKTAQAEPAKPRSSRTSSPNEG